MLAAMQINVQYHPKSDYFHTHHGANSQYVQGCVGYKGMAAHSQNGMLQYLFQKQLIILFIPFHSHCPLKAFSMGF